LRPPSRGDRVTSGVIVDGRAGHQPVVGPSNTSEAQVNLLLMHGCGRSVGPLCNFDCEHKNRRQPFRLGRFLRRFRWLTGNLGAPGKSFRAKRLYDVDARGACRREHRSDYRRA
jgi:hypothetical protein